MQDDLEAILDLSDSSKLPDAQIDPDLSITIAVDNLLESIRLLDRVLLVIFDAIE